MVGLEIEQRIKSMIHSSEVELRDSPLLDAAIYRTLKEARARDASSGDELYRRAIERARELHREWAAPRGASRLTATDMLAGEALVKALASEVAALREEGFGGPEPPFESLQAASDWIEHQAERDLAAWREKKEGRNKARDEINRLASEHGIELGFKATLLRYQKPGDEHVKNVHAVPSTYLHKLARKVESMAKYTGLPADALTTHILTGLKPIKGRARITTTEKVYTLPSGEQIATADATVSFRARDLTDKELRSIYNAVRAHVGGKGTKGLDYQDVDLWELVQDLGGPPREHGSKGVFWEEVRQRYNREHPSAQPYTTPNGVKKRYQSISQHLKPR